MELFELDKDFLVKLNVELGTIKEFAEIIKRDQKNYASKKENGEITTVRDKRQARKEFTFIYHFKSFKSSFRNYSEEQRLLQSIRNSELPEGFDYKKDEKLVEAIKKYEEFQVTRSLKAVQAGFKAVDNVTDYLNNTPVTGQNLKDVMATVKSLGSVIDSLKQLEEQVKKELTGEAALRGNARKGSREDRKKFEDI